MAVWKTFPLKLVASRNVTPSILHLAFRREDGEVFEYKAGQFINIHFEDEGKPIHRSYSVANPPGSELIEIAMSPVENGRATRLLSGLEPGDVIDASGPYGRFILKDDEPTRYVMVATGTGVTPYRAMLPEIETRLSEGFSVDLMLGIWRRDEALYAEDFIHMADRHENFTYHACYSREMPEDKTEHELQGYVQNQFPGMELDPERDIVYLCGNPDMIDQAVEFLREKAFPTGHMRREKYVSAKS